MPKTRPQDGDTNWGEILNAHLAQTLGENGGINIGENDPTLTVEDAGFTYINTTTGELKQWDGGIWKVLLKDINSSEASELKFDNDNSNLVSNNMQNVVDEIVIRTTIKPLPPGYDIYLATDGYNDTEEVRGFTVNTPLGRFEHIREVLEKYDFEANNVTIHIADGSYSFEQSAFFDFRLISLNNTLTFIGSAFSNVSITTKLHFYYFNTLGYLAFGGITFDNKVYPSQGGLFFQACDRVNFSLNNAPRVRFTNTNTSRSVNTCLTLEKTSGIGGPVIFENLNSQSENIVVFNGSQGDITIDNNSSNIVTNSNGSLFKATNYSSVIINYLGGSFNIDGSLYNITNFSNINRNNGTIAGTIPGTIDATSIYTQGNYVNTKSGLTGVITNQEAIDLNASSIGSNVQTLSNFIYLNKYSPIYQILNPNGSNRDVFLPYNTPFANEIVRGHRFLIKNSGSSGNLVVKEPSNQTIITTLTPNQKAEIYNNGTNWLIF